MHCTDSQSALKPGSITILPLEDPDAAAETEPSQGLAGQMQWPWKLQAVAVPVVPAPAAATRVRMPPAPLPMHAFVRAVTKVAGVRCVVVEEGEGRTVHVTTFVAPLTDDARQAVYRVEADTISGNPDLIFDFHLRRADEAEGGVPVAGAAAHYYAVWGSVGHAKQG